MRATSLTEHTQGIHRYSRAVASEAISPDIRNVWEGVISALADNGPAVWLRADLHPANAVIVDGAIGGEIDFGGLCAGERVVDLAADWLLLPVGSLARVLADYGAAGQDVIRRVRGRTVPAAFGLLSVGITAEAGESGGEPGRGWSDRKPLDRIVAGG